MPDSPADRSVVLVLLVDSDAAEATPFVHSLRAAMRVRPEIVHVSTGRQATDWLRSGRCDMLLADLASVADLGDTAEQAMQRLVRLAGSALVLALSDGGSVSAAVAAMRGGAHDHLVRPLGADTLAARLREIAGRHGRLRIIAPKGEVRAGRFAELLGSSSQIQAVVEQLGRSSASDAPVFITGESGTGKDLAARALHGASPRADGPFLALNCATSRDDIAAALFGAAGRQTSAIDRAAGGTLFLDEIGELDFDIQGRLLRLMQNGALQSGVGGEDAVDVRLVCATARSPMQLISDRRFREELFYRLHVLPIHLPPLRQRTGDAAELAALFLARYAAQEGRDFTGFSAEALALIAGGDWPGNIRQLQNFVRRLVVLYEGGEISARMVTEADFEGSLRLEGLHPTLTEAILPMWRQEQRIIESAIETFAGNVALAAAALELSPSTIYRKRQAWAEMDGKRGAA